MSMNGGVMRSGQLTAAAGLGAPLVPFASLPAASTVEGQVRRLTELPHVSLIALGGIWRPFGGRQVLASRSTNPVTVQSLTGEVAETIGPFPGGLVRAGMRLEMQTEFEHPGVNSARYVFLLAGNSLVNSANAFAYNITTGNQSTGTGRLAGMLAVLSDSNAAHMGKLGANSGSYLSGGNTRLTPTVDFSAPWYVGIYNITNGETAVNISTATWVGGYATYNTSAAHTLAVGDKTVIASVTPSGYNGTFIVLSVPTSTQFTVAIAVDPVGNGSGGTSSRISNIISQSYVLELVG